MRLGLCIFQECSSGPSNKRFVHPLMFSITSSKTCKVTEKDGFDYIKDLTTQLKKSKDANDLYNNDDPLESCIDEIFNNIDSIDDSLNDTNYNSIIIDDETV